MAYLCAVVALCALRTKNLEKLVTFAVACPSVERDAAY